MSGPTASAGLDLLRSQLFYHPPLPTSSFSGQTVIVTGANAGLGREAAKYIARLDASRLIIACRTTSKGEEAKKWIVEQTKSDTEIEVWPLDQSSFASVKTFAGRVRSLPRLDAVLENAGTWPSSFEQAEGHEATITVNVISTFLLAYLLLPKLRETAVKYNTTPRLTVVSSDLHRSATPKARHHQSGETTTITTNLFANLKQTTTDYDGRYNDSKLLEVMFIRKLAAHFNKTTGGDRPGQVCLSTMNPGWCHSALKSPEGFGQRHAERMLARTTDEGGMLLADSIAADKVEGRHGQYISEARITKPAVWLETTEGKQTEDMLWKELNEILEGVVPGCTQLS